MKLLNINFQTACVFLIFLIAASALCPPNEVPTDCEDICNRCEITGSCAFLVCNKGCNCIEGYKRNENGVCIPASQCPPNNNCGLNEVYKECGTACPKTCKNKDIMIACIDLCVKGCFCEDGFIRNDDGVCINPEECPQKNCPENETYNNCGSACPDTCKTAGKPRMCTLQCVSGCFCNKGLVRNDKGICINPKKCKTPVCGANEEYKNCGTACPRTCKNKDAMIKCTSQCVSGCFCLNGMVRADDGQCVYPEECSTDSTEYSEES